MLLCCELVLMSSCPCFLFCFFKLKLLIAFKIDLAGSLRQNGCFEVRSYHFNSVIYPSVPERFEDSERITVRKKGEDEEVATRRNSTAVCPVL